MSFHFHKDSVVRFSIPITTRRLPPAGALQGPAEVTGRRRRPSLGTVLEEFPRDALERSYAAEGHRRAPPLGAASHRTRELN